MNMPIFTETGSTLRVYSIDHLELFRDLMDTYCLPAESIILVSSIADWCLKNGLPEPDPERPFRLVTDPEKGCSMLVRRVIAGEVIQQHIRALSIRNQLKSVAYDRSEKLNSTDKKLAYLFLTEYATSLLGISDDESAADDWAFKELERLGFFRT